MSADPEKTPRTHPSQRNDGDKLFGSGRLANRLHLPSILQNEATGGIVMMVATVIALLWANLASSSYTSISHHYLGPLSVAHWASDGLLTIFFFMAGMELKRELVEGSLSRPKDALVPIVAAVTGMLVPAGLYLLVNTVMDGGQSHGWAVPMATDIAFALAVLAIVGRRLPTGVRAFLLTLAIVDDLGAIIVIAVFFSSGIKLLWLAAVAALLVLWWWMQRQRPGNSNGWLHLPVAVAAWWAMLQSGVHATIAGVLLGLMVHTIETEMDDNLDRWQRKIHPLSSWLAVPIFALFAAGVPVSMESLGALWSEPVALGIILGLIAGKTVGVFGGAWLTAQLTSATLARGVRWGDIAAVSVLAGIGFTVSMLISELAFTAHPETTTVAKTAVLVASLIAAIIGGALVSVRGRRHLNRQREREQAIV